MSTPSPADLTKPLLDAFEARDRERVVAELRRLIVAKAPLQGGWSQISRLAETIGEVTLSIRAQQLMVAANPGDALPVLELGALCLRLGRQKESLDIALKLAGALPEMPAAHYLVGYAYAQLGDAARATDSLHAAIKLTPNAGDAWVLLATVKKFTKDDPDIPMLKDACAQALVPEPETRGSLHLALGKALDDIGEHDRAFAAFAEAARVFGERFPYEPEPEENFVEIMEASFDRAFLDTLKPSQVRSDRPIFVVGMPRSGTTLMEQILTAHSQVSAGGEINLLQPAMFGLDAVMPLEVDAYIGQHGRDDTWTRFGETYLHLLDERFGREGRIVDKSLNTGRLLGLALHMLPNARVIWMQRDPRDVCWSAYRTRFGAGEAWSWSLEGMARHVKVEQRLHRHWSAMFPNEILTVPYESLVDDPDTWIPRALTHCGLADEPATRAFYDSGRAVGTASLSQVRKPMSKSSIGAWRKYEKHLAPYFDAMQV